MKKILSGLLCVVLICMVASTIFAQEQPRIKQTDQEKNIVAMAQADPRASGWYGPLYVDWIEMGLDYLYIEFTNGNYAVLQAGYYDIGALASVATSCRSDSRVVWVEVINDVPVTFQIQ